MWAPFGLQPLSDLRLHGLQNHHPGSSYRPRPTPHYWESFGTCLSTNYFQFLHVYHFQLFLLLLFWRHFLSCSLTTLQFCFVFVFFIRTTFYFSSLLPSSPSRSQFLLCFYHFFLLCHRSAHSLSCLASLLSGCYNGLNVKHGESLASCKTCQTQLRTSTNKERSYRGQ